MKSNFFIDFHNAENNADYNGYTRQGEQEIAEQAGEEITLACKPGMLIPMVVAPLIANPIIKKSGEFVDENGLTAYLPTYTLLLVGAALVLLTIIPLIPAKKYHDKRISEKTAEGKE